MFHGNTKTISQLSGYNFGDYFTTGRMDRYKLMCDIYAYDRIHP